MGDGFIAGQVQSADQVLRGLNGLFFHGKILARCLLSFRVPLVPAKSAASFLSSSAFSPLLLSLFLYYRPVFHEALPVPQAEVARLRDAYD